MYQIFDFRHSYPIKILRNPASKVKFWLMGKKVLPTFPVLVSIGLSSIIPAYAGVIG